MRTRNKAQTIKLLLNRRISQGGVAKSLRCDDFKMTIANLLLNMPMNKNSVNN